MRVHPNPWNWTTIANPVPLVTWHLSLLGNPLQDKFFLVHRWGMLVHRWDLLVHRLDLLGHPWVLLGHHWDLLGHHLVLLGHHWDLLGHHWDLLGHHWDLLGRLVPHKVHLGRHKVLWGHQVHHPKVVLLHLDQVLLGTNLDPVLLDQPCMQFYIQFQMHLERDVGATIEMALIY